MLPVVVEFMVLDVGVVVVSGLLVLVVVVVLRRILLFVVVEPVVVAGAVVVEDVVGVVVGSCANATKAKAKGNRLSFFTESSSC